jgi:GTP pyrophosphokinase
VTEVEWVSDPREDLFSIRLAILARDRQGLLAAITSAISNLKTNIRESRSSATSEGRSSVEVTVEIYDSRHLQKVIQTLKSIRGIEEVERVGKLP